ncbi:MAG TPA: elongation factor G-like protein EF-G2 [Actinomycetes bacterium]|nr:elongation factor G-like protein EF-G2 [Actinomycetes bacterium]
MKSYPTDRVRNVLVVGHGGSGKTTLVEALLHATGATTRIGRVEDGTTVTDFEPEETRKHISVSLALAPVEHDGFKVNLLDAPGYADFVGEVRAALPAADAVLFVVSGVEGVETQTEVVWTMAEELGLPRAFFVNKLDRDRASFRRSLGQIQATFGKGAPPLYLPVGEEQEFGGLVGLLSGKAVGYAGGARSDADVPADLADEVEDLRSQLIESIIQESEDEGLMDRYLEGQPIAPEDLIPDLGKAVAAGRLFPVLAGSGAKGIGTLELLEILTQGFPGPAEHRPYEGAAPGGGKRATRRADPDGPLAAYVFKTVSDPYVGRINLFRVVSGTFRPDSTALNANHGREERIGHLLTLRGKHQESVDRVVAGDIGAVAKLVDTSTGDTLCDKADPVVLDAPAMPDPLLPVAIAPKSKGDEEKLSTALARAVAEDLTLRVDRNAETRQTVLWGMGENHVELTLERLKRKYGVEVTTVPLRLPYKETFRAPVKAMGRHVKQSGGHGQYGICHIEVEPLPRGEGFEFVDKIYGGSVPHQFIPSVEKGVRKAMDDGLVAGYPVVDVRVRLVDGKYHSVDSSDMAFQIAGAMALKEAAASADMTLLEPILEVEVLIPDAFVGDVLGDLSSRRGRVVGTDPVGTGRTLVRAHVPESEAVRYAIDLRSMTHGRGSFSRRFAHYEELPANLAQRVIEQVKEARAG